MVLFEVFISKLNSHKIWVTEKSLNFRTLMFLVNEKVCTYSHPKPNRTLDTFKCLILNEMQILPFRIGQNNDFDNFKGVKLIKYKILAFIIWTKLKVWLIFKWKVTIWELCTLISISLWKTCLVRLIEIGVHPNMFAIFQMKHIAK